MKTSTVNNLTKKSKSLQPQKSRGFRWDCQKAAAPYLDR